MLSVIIITKNEAGHIGRCLESVSWADEIIVLDSGSTDETVAICESYGAQVYVTDWPGFGPQKQRALDKATHEWVLSLDADEEVSPLLKEEILHAISQNVFKAFQIPRLSSYCGRNIHHGGWRPDYVLRLFKREVGRFTPDLVHERVIVNCQTSNLHTPLNHESFVNLSEVLQKIDSYSTLNAKKLFLLGKKTTILHAIGHALWNFFKTYVLKASFLDGQHGLMLAISNAEGSYYKYAKLIEYYEQKKLNDKLISVIVSTYNRPDALKATLDSLLCQSDSNFEIIIADDGSTSETQNMIEGFISKNPKIKIYHVYQADQGFRLSRIRNKAIIRSHGEYLIFLDGDCITQNNFVAKHRQLSDPGYFVTGNRVLMNQEHTELVLQQNINIHQKSFFYLFGLRLQNKINRFISFISLPLGILRYLQPYAWRKAIGCNTAFWKSDLLAVNGYDEGFIGWGYEDSDLLIRLLHNGIKRKEGRFAIPVLHLWHKQNDRSRHDENYQRLQERINDPSFKTALMGIEHHLKSGSQPD